MMNLSFLLLLLLSFAIVVVVMVVMVAVSLVVVTSTSHGQIPHPRVVRCFIHYRGVCFGFKGSPRSIAVPRNELLLLLLLSTPLLVPPPSFWRGCKPGL